MSDTSSEFDARAKLNVLLANATPLEPDNVKELGQHFKRSENGQLHVTRYYLCDNMYKDLLEKHILGRLLV